ncbi:hypothetical protein [Acinetobacter phage AbTZA1]|uniref:Uncharacterized protein n=1 Tax=Acinetobacter phage AbTZA1 TaxID=2500827 RepID=A0A3T0IGY0_9CAUD|nr:hypothetical protein HYP74_gp141 [Acinetobacter phage AbTZA1]AZU98675.1 hypothetical protein [Acinetobacter phage AbTZA1]QQO96403.1 hypothetical protein CPT_Minot_209 [Acinetobacter phage Minot]QQO96652.1 hypothetical protein CPT_Mokit_210 [Acinetobacter phage Mokit]QQO96907.1 hypothetical protein CPT_Melin_215 [Acinetobacter phage Melin]
MKAFSQFAREVNFPLTESIDKKFYVLITRVGKDGITRVQHRDEWFTAAQLARFKRNLESDGYEKSNNSSITVKGYDNFAKWYKDAIAAKANKQMSWAHDIKIPSSESYFVPY